MNDYRKAYFGLVGLIGMLMIFYITSFGSASNPRKLWMGIVLMFCMYMLSQIMFKGPDDNDFE